MELVLALIAVAELIALGFALYFMVQLAVSFHSAMTELTMTHSEDIRQIVTGAAAERGALEDRLMAVCNPEQLHLFKALEETEPEKATYVDEGKEYALQTGGTGNGDAPEPTDD